MDCPVCGRRLTVADAGQRALHVNLCIERMSASASAVDAYVPVAVVTATPTTPISPPTPLSMRNMHAPSSPSSLGSSTQLPSQPPSQLPSQPPSQLPSQPPPRSSARHILPQSTRSSRTAPLSQTSLRGFLGLADHYVPACFVLDVPTMRAHFTRDVRERERLDVSLQRDKRDPSHLHFLGNFRWAPGTHVDHRLFSSVPLRVWRRLMRMSSTDMHAMLARQHVRMEQCVSGTSAATLPCSQKHPPLPLSSSVPLSSSQAADKSMPNFGHYPLSFLKSHLQKAVRRSSPMHAVLSAYHIIAGPVIDDDTDPVDGWVQLTRRLPVIMVEDAMVVPEVLVPLVWLMLVASVVKKACAADGEADDAANENNGEVSKNGEEEEETMAHIVWWLLAAVETIAACPNRDPVSADKLRRERRTVAQNEAARVKRRRAEDAEEQQDDDNADYLEEERPANLECRFVAEELRTDQRDVLYALRLRANYGGMKFDKGMLETSIKIWLARFQRHHSLSQHASPSLKRSTITPAPSPPLPSTPYPLNLAPPLRPLTRAYRARIAAGRGLMPSNWLLPAIDHHCFPGLVDGLWAQFSGDLQRKIMRVYGGGGAASSSVSNGDTDESGGMDFIRAMIWERSGSVNRKSLVDKADEERMGVYKDALMDAVWRDFEPVVRNLAERELQRRVKF